MKKLILASTITAALLTATGVQAATGGDSGMTLKNKSANTKVHHTMQGSALHENAADAHSRAASYHKKAADAYRKKQDESAIRHAKKAIFASGEAAIHTEETKDILPK